MALTVFMHLSILFNLDNRLESVFRAVILSIEKNFPNVTSNVTSILKVANNPQEPYAFLDLTFLDFFMPGFGLKSRSGFGLMLSG